MIQSIKNYFNQYLLPEDASAAKSPEQSLQIATAALLIELIHADNEIKPEEKLKTLQIVQDTYLLSETAAQELIAMAEQELREATDYFQFTRLINKNYTEQQKIQIVEGLWKVALADNELDKFEEYTIRKIADLLYIPHNQFIAAKLKVYSSIA